MDGTRIFFDGWTNLLQILIIAPVLYLTIIRFVRLAGKRSTSQMNNFDWIVTVAMGSIVGSGIILKDVTLSESAFAVFVLLAVQWGVTKALMHSEHVRAVVKAEPRVLARHGTYIRSAMEEERITEQEVQSALREAGLRDLSQTEAVVLETDASISVLARA